MRRSPVERRPGTDGKSAFLGVCGAGRRPSGRGPSGRGPAPTLKQRSAEADRRPKASGGVRARQRLARTRQGGGFLPLSLVRKVEWMRRKHVPQRTCVGCRKVRPKREMVRIVRTPDQGVKIDQSGKASGRGAYLCRDRTCWEKALSEKRLEYALKTGLSPKEWATLLAFGQSLELTDEAVKG